jgi:xylulokinase
VIWMDNRARSEAEEIRRRIPKEVVYAKTGRRVSPELLAPKLLWFSRRRRGITRRIRSVIGLKDDMIRRLTGIVQTDVAHLDYSMLFNIHEGRLDSDICAELGMKPGWFPEPRMATDVVGSLSPEAARGFGLQGGLPVISGSLDGTTAMYGGGVLDEGVAVLVTGTTEVLMTASSRAVEDPDRTLTVNTGMVPGVYLVGGAMGLAGGAFPHLERLLSGTVRSLQGKIRRLPPGSDGLLVLPGLTGERSPYWMDYVTGGMAGLTVKHRPEHVFRAAMEAAAFRVRRLVELLRASGLSPGKLHVTGGYADLNVWNRIRADVLGLDVLRPRATEATSLGTAMFCKAGLEGPQVLSDLARKWIRIGRRYRPDPELTQGYGVQAQMFDEYIRSTAGFYQHLSRIQPNGA